MSCGQRAFAFLRADKKEVALKMINTIAWNHAPLARKSALTGGASALAFALAFAATPALAAPCGAVNVVTTDCDGPVTPASGDFMNAAKIITNTVSPTPAVIINNGIAINNFVNINLIRVGNGNTVAVNGSIANFTNHGIIQSANSAAILINANAFITNLTNENTIAIGGDGLRNHGRITTLTNTAQISGTSFSIVNEQTGAIETLTNSSMLARDVFNEGLMGAVTNDRGQISGTQYGLHNSATGTITTVKNSGTINGSTKAGIYNLGGQVDTITNQADGTISGGNNGIYNTGTITTLENAGTILGPNGIFNQNGTISSLKNSGLLGDTSTFGIRNSGTITDLVNEAAGQIAGINAGIVSSGALAALTNHGVIKGNASGLEIESGSVGTVTNSATGQITGPGKAIYNYTGTVTALNNAGTIASTGSQAIYSTGTITTLDNSGTISGTYAIENSGSTNGPTGSIAALINSGTITGVTSGIYNNGGTIDRIDNSDTISGDRIGIENAIGATITALTNTGKISGTSFAGIYSEGAIGQLDNSATISSDNVGIINWNAIDTLINSGEISGGITGIYSGAGTIGTLSNLGTISGDTIALENLGTITQLNNSAKIDSLATGIINSGAIDTLFNSGTISGGTNGIYLSGGSNGTYIGGATIGTLSNLGTISGAVRSIDNWGVITALRNFGVIEGVVANKGMIQTLVNGQGGASSGGKLAPLVLSGTMIAGGYTAHITSPTHYGQLVYTGTEGTLTAFTLTGESNLEKLTYQDLLTGIQKVEGPLSGQIGRFKWSLVADAATAGNWDLLVKRLGPDAANSLLALGYSRDQIMTALANRAARITHLLGNDCSSFGSAGMCLSGQMRRAEYRDESETTLGISAGVRITANLRAGAFVDMPIHRKSRLTGLSTDQDTVSYGGFIGYSQKGDGSGLQARLVAAVHGQDIIITRAATLADTEAGRGQSRLKTWAVEGELGYGFAVAPGNYVVPQIGLRHVRAARAAYAEAAGSAVEFPFTYGAYGLRSTTAQVGVAARGDLGGRLSYRVSTGIEWDMASRSDAFAGTSQADDLPGFSLSKAGTANRLRGNGAVELGYEFAKGAVATLGGSLRGEAFTDKVTTQVSAGIRFGF